MQSRIPLQKVRDQRQPELLAFLRMKLRADKIVTADDRGDRTAVVRFRDQIEAGLIDFVSDSKIAGESEPASTSLRMESS